MRLESIRSTNMSSIKQHYYFIVNPYASNGLKVSKNLNQLLEKTNLDYQLKEITEQVNIKDIVTELQPHLQENDILVSVGGDGTISEVVQAANELGIPNPIGVIPTGSGNDFARFHGIPTNLKDAFLHLLTINKYSEQDIILTMTNEQKKKYVVNSIGAGIDGRVIFNLQENRGSKKIGKLAYLIDALKSLFSQSYFDAEIIINGRSLKIYQTIILLFMNHGSFGGGINIHPNTLSSDGYIDIIFSHHLSIFDQMTIIPKLLINQSHIKHPKIFTLKARELTVNIHTNEYWQADGESLSNTIQSCHMQTKKQKYWI